MNIPTRTGVIKYINGLIDDVASGKMLPFDDRDHLAKNISIVMDIPLSEAEAHISPEADLFLAKANGANSPKSYSIFAGTITDGYGAVIGLAFPVDVGYKAIVGLEAWKQYRRDTDTLFAEWTTSRVERDLLAAHIRGEVTYEKIRHLVAKTTEGNGNGQEKNKPDYGCDCVLPEQVCGGCEEKIKKDFERWERTGELPF